MDPFTPGAPLAFDLGPLLLLYGAPLALNLGTQLALETHGHLKGIVLALDSGLPLALGAHWLLIWSPISSRGPRFFQRGLINS